MNPLDLGKVRDYVNENVVDFHQRRILSLEGLKLEKLLNKNPYLFKAKNISTAGDFITGLLEAFLSSSEEKLFGDFLEGLAVFIAEMTCGGHKSTVRASTWNSSTTASTMWSRSNLGRIGATARNKPSSSRTSETLWPESSSPREA